MSAIDLYLLGVVCLAVLLGFVAHSVRVFRRAAEAGPLRDELQSLRNEESRLKSDIAKADKRIGEQEKELITKRAEKARAEEIIAFAKKEKQWLDDHAPTIAQLREKEAFLKESVKSQTDKKNELAEVIQTLHEEKESLETKLRDDLKPEENRLLASVNEKKVEIEFLGRTIDSIKNELANTEKELVPKRDELERLRSEIAKLEGSKKELARLEDEIARKKKELEEIDRTISQRKPEAAKIISDARSKAEQVLSKAEETAKAKAEQLVEHATGFLRTDRNNLQKEIENLQKAKAQLIAEVGDLRQKTGTAKDCWKELDNPAVPNIMKPDDFDPIQDEEAKRLDAFKQNLRDHGLVFHDRTVNAFHTGLKIADASSLVVLSGISGTGKSLLPQLYAKAFGMNFLPLAVQPRWDGPQDMLGFYNYMERRYKATELARLLWQYDIFNNKAAKNAFGGEAGSLPMNLVLLDEMNIARVEYYFSDFLSKLELRRNIDPADDSARRSVEIEIEGGVPTLADMDGKTDKEKEQLVKSFFTRRLFVGRNTLFVGTMNEDESTQTLSDKVIDRSNVIRFGKPANLAATSDTKGFMSLYEYDPEYRPDRMQFGDWRNWIIDPDDYSDATRGDVIRVASALNNAMETMGRPFGIRNIQAILAYCENYPEQGPSGFKRALADQIEMKVLPKLNGLEKDDLRVKEGLEKVMDVLKKEIGEADEVSIVDAEGNETNQKVGICRAFEEAMNPNSGVFFKWKGISR